MIQSINRYWGYSLFLIAVYMLNPLCGILLAAFLYYREDESNGYLYLLFIFMAAYMGVINMTKKPASDLIAYLQIFNNVPIKGFWKNIFDYSSNTGREPLYGLINYLGYYFTGGNAALFIFFLTIGIYLLPLQGIHMIFKHANCSKSAILCGAFVLTFFSLYFLVTAHLVRQVLATSFIVYAIAYRTVSGKNNWFFLAFAVFTHSMTAILVIISFIPQIYKRLSIMQALIIASCFLLIIIFNTQVAQLLSGMTPVKSIDYAIRRFGSVGSAEGNLQMWTKVIITVPLSIVVCRLLYVIRHEPQHPLYSIINVYWLLLLIIFSFYSNTLIQGRFFMIMYSLVSFIVPLLFYRLEKMNYWYSLVVSIFFVCSFFIMYNASAWHYAEMEELLLYPFPVLFFQPHLY